MRVQARVFPYVTEKKQTVNNIYIGPKNPNVAEKNKTRSSESKIMKNKAAKSLIIKQKTLDERQHSHLDMPGRHTQDYCYTSTKNGPGRVLNITACVRTAKK